VEWLAYHTHTVEKDQTTQVNWGPGLHVAVGHHTVRFATSRMLSAGSRPDITSRPVSQNPHQFVPGCGRKVVVEILRYLVATAASLQACKQRSSVKCLQLPENFF